METVSMKYIMIRKNNNIEKLSDDYVNSNIGETFFPNDVFYCSSLFSTFAHPSAVMCSNNEKLYGTRIKLPVIIRIAKDIDISKLLINHTIYKLDISLLTPSTKDYYKTLLVFDSKLEFSKWKLSI